MTHDAVPSPAEDVPHPVYDAAPRVPPYDAGGFESQWWRALAVFRAVSVVYAALLYLRFADSYARPVAGWLAVGAMVVWTVVVTGLYRRPGLRRAPLLTADLLVGAAAVVVTRLLQTPAQVEAGAQTLPVTWVAAPVLAWAVVHGWVAAIGAGLVVGAANVAERGAVTAPLLHNTVLVLLSGAVVGYVATLGRRAEARLAEALAVEAATRERDRLARTIHDGVLQVLGYVARRGRELGGDAAELGRLAGEQEQALRSLVATRATASVPGGEADLRELLGPHAARGVSVAAPAEPVLVEAHAGAELAAAVAALLDNVARHAGPGARAWVLVEDEPDAVVVTVRDDGVGMAPGRLAEAREQGRLGVALSVLGRVTELGGTVAYDSAPGRGTEVEVRVPRRGGPAAGGSVVPAVRSREGEA